MSELADNQILGHAARETVQRPQGSQAPKSVEQEAKPLVNQTELWEIRAVTRYRYPQIDAVLFVKPLGWFCRFAEVPATGTWPPITRE